MLWKTRARATIQFLLVTVRVLITMHHTAANRVNFNRKRLLQSTSLTFAALQRGSSKSSSSQKSLTRSPQGAVWRSVSGLRSPLPWHDVHGVTEAQLAAGPLSADWSGVLLWQSCLLVCWAAMPFGKTGVSLWPESATREDKTCLQVFESEVMQVWSFYIRRLSTLMLKTPILCLLKFLSVLFLSVFLQ